MPSLLGRIPCETDGDTSRLASVVSLPSLGCIGKNRNILIRTISMIAIIIIITILLIFTGDEYQSGHRSVFCSC